MMMGNKETVPVIMPEMLLETRKMEEEKMASPDAGLEEAAGEIMSAIKDGKKMKLARALKAFIGLMEELEDMEEEGEEESPELA